MTTSAETTGTTEATRRALAACEAFSRAMIAGDANALEGLLRADFEYTHSNARVEPGADLIASVRGGRRNREMAFSGLATRAYAGTVLVTGRNHMVTGGDPGVTFDAQFTAVVVDAEGDARLAAYHSTRLPEA